MLVLYVVCLQSSVYVSISFHIFLCRVLLFDAMGMLLCCSVLEWRHASQRNVCSVMTVRDSAPTQVLGGRRQYVVELFVCGHHGQGVVDHDSRTYLAVSAAWQRKTECLRVILTHGVVLDGRVTAAAASGGSLACLRLAHRGFGDKLRESTVHTAAWTGDGHSRNSSLNRPSPDIPHWY